MESTASVSLVVLSVLEIDFMISIAFSLDQYNSFEKEIVKKVDIHCKTDLQSGHCAQLLYYCILILTS